MDDRPAARTRRVTLPFNADEFRRLQRIARVERRTVRDQVAHVVSRWLDCVDTPGLVGQPESGGGGDRADERGDNGRPA